MATVSEGDRLRAEATGRVYRVRKIDGQRVFVKGLPPVEKDELERDIERGKITKLG